VTISDVPFGLGWVLLIQAAFLGRYVALALVKIGRATLRGLLHQGRHRITQ
jgi:hypothetical protein